MRLLNFSTVEMKFGWKVDQNWIATQTRTGPTMKRKMSNLIFKGTGEFKLHNVTNAINKKELSNLRSNN